MNTHSPLAAISVHRNETLLLFTLLQLTVIVAAGRLGESPRYTRGLMELVVINVGYDLGVISQQMFTMLVIMAIVSTVITTPALRHYLPRAGWEPSTALHRCPRTSDRPSS